MPIARLPSVDVYYETFGEPSDDAVVLIMGMGSQLTGWDERWCRRLAALGHHVIRYDHRGVGFSSDAGAFEIDDLAGDVVALLDHLGIGCAAVVGASMGAMVAQRVAIDHPERVTRLVSIMGTTGASDVGWRDAEVLAAVQRRAAASAEEAVDAGLDLWRRTRSPGFRRSERQARAFIEREVARAFRPLALQRQLDAVSRAVDRTAELGALRCPALVVHGDRDRMIDVSGGVATAAAIPGAELRIIEGMGHDLPFEIWPLIMDWVHATAPS